MHRSLLVAALTLLSLACSDGGTAPPAVAAVTVAGAAGALSIGQSVQLTAIAKDMNGAAVEAGAPVWSSGASAVASVSPTGLVTAQTVGTTMISARIAGVVGTFQIIVTSPTSFDVFTPGYIFSPLSLTVPVGATVNWYMYGEEHNAIFDRSVPGAPPDILIVQNVIVSRTFNTIGTFPYDCTVHPGMVGEIVVTAVGDR